eukprot:CAMPEP_0204468454 /NCGR_PEP_ID=MMETSP0471-20130131/10529_1 /ASSEMBLY_ACC=CAM_ASM_000602 /TAXON_ID=2969 /ORGANISM="Oxyrrhis marina" /LENGTH=210 /DNA_ID=CAMNT_0051470269 /DNA_START=192 /DNA_END=820 /DNA_ORIENTATION=+
MRAILVAGLLACAAALQRVDVEDRAGGDLVRAAEETTRREVFWGSARGPAPAAAQEAGQRVALSDPLGTYVLSVLRSAERSVDRNRTKTNREIPSALSAAEPELASAWPAFVAARATIRSMATTKLLLCFLFVAAVVAGVFLVALRIHRSNVAREHEEMERQNDDLLARLKEEYSKEKKGKKKKPKRLDKDPEEEAGAGAEGAGAAGPAG